MSVAGSVVFDFMASSQLLSGSERCSLATASVSAAKRKKKKINKTGHATPS